MAQPGRRHPVGSGSALPHHMAVQVWAWFAQVWAKVQPGRRWTSAASAFCCWMTARCGSRLQHSSSCGRTCGCCCWSPFGWCAAAATAGPSPAARSPAGSWQSCSSSSSRTGPGPRGHPPQLWGAPVLAQGPQPGPVASQVHCQVAAQRGAVHAGGGEGPRLCIGAG
jgi:hypothetical protein